LPVNLCLSYGIRRAVFDSEHFECAPKRGGIAHFLRISSLRARCSVFTGPEAASVDTNNNDWVVHGGRDLQLQVGIGSTSDV
jgi:hypothetical protein